MLENILETVNSGFIGFIVGDALGVPVEFFAREVLKATPLTEMVGNGSHGVPKGAWSDDTSMLLATVDAIIIEKGIDDHSIMDAFLRWVDNNDYCSTDKIFGVGRGVCLALGRYSRTRNLETCVKPDPRYNGNGSLMRILPISYYAFYKKLNNLETYELIKNMSSLTHPHEISIMGCYIFTLFIHEFLKNNNKEAAYSTVKAINYDELFEPATIDAYSRILKDNITKIDEDAIKSSGFVVDTLEAALWSFFNTDSYKEGVLKAINLGGDTDTIGAVIGAIAGLYYGFESIPVEWVNQLLKLDYINDQLLVFSHILNNK